MAQTPGRDFRKQVRILSLNLVSYSQFDEEGQISETSMGRTLDISEGGIKLEVGHRYPISSDLEISMQIAERLIHVRGKVVHVEELKNGKVGIGINFTQINPDDKRALKEFLSS